MKRSFENQRRKVRKMADVFKESTYFVVVLKAYQATYFLKLLLSFGNC